MGNTLRDSLGNELWSVALAKATMEDRSVADVVRELVGDWIRETPEDAEARAKTRQMEVELAALRAEQASYKRVLREWQDTGRSLQAQLDSLSASLPDSQKNIPVPGIGT